MSPLYWTKTIRSIFYQNRGDFQNHLIKKHLHCVLMNLASVVCFRSWADKIRRRRALNNDVQWRIIVLVVISQHSPCRHLLRFANRFFFFATGRWEFGKLIQKKFCAGSNTSATSVATPLQYLHSTLNRLRQDIACAAEPLNSKRSPVSLTTSKNQHLMLLMHS